MGAAGERHGHAMWQHEEQERQEVTWLLEEMDEWSQRQHSLVQEGVFLAACQQRWFGGSAEALLMLWAPQAVQVEE